MCDRHMTANKIDFAGWNECVGRVIASIDHPAVLGELLDSLGKAVPFDLCDVSE